MPTVYKTISWRFCTANKKVKCKCSKCGKTINKTFTDEYREDSSPDWEDLEKQATKWLEQVHICDKCLKALSTVEVNDISENFAEDIDKILSMNKQIVALIDQRNNYITEIYKNIHGHVLIYDGKEYQADYLSYNAEFTRLYCYKINTHKPWRITDTWITVALDPNDKDGVPLAECKITDEIFAERAEKVRNAK